MDVAGEDPVEKKNVSDDGVESRDEYGRKLHAAVGRGESKGVDWTDPNSVRMMLMKRSAPQPAIMKTPTGGTARCERSAWRLLPLRFENASRQRRAYVLDACALERV